VSATSKSPIDHHSLCQEAAKWLLQASVPLGRRLGEHTSTTYARCDVALVELRSAAAEQPDVLAWSGGVSILIEVKTSRSDFAADAKKHFRQHPEFGMGRYRYYLAPSGVLAVNDMPDKWGLLEWDGKRIRVVSTAEFQEQHAVYYEVRMLQSALRRLPPGTQAVSARYFQHKLASGTDIHVLEDTDEG